MTFFIILVKTRSAHIRCKSMMTISRDCISRKQRNKGEKNSKIHASLKNKTKLNSKNKENINLDRI